MTHGARSTRGAAPAGPVIVAPDGLIRRRFPGGRSSGSGGPLPGGGST